MPPGPPASDCVSPSAIHRSAVARARNSLRVLRLALAQQKEESRGGHTWRMLVAGKGLSKDVINGAAARLVVAAREGRAKERVREKGETEGGDVNLRP